MSESGQRNESPLLSDRGTTIISGTVVSTIAGMAAQEVEGVHMGGEPREPPAEYWGALRVRRAGPAASPSRSEGQRQP